MKNWSSAVRDGLLSGALAAVTTIATLAVCGRRDNARSLAPINAVSHVFWGDEAFREGDATLRHTLPGMLVHGASALLWGVLYEKLVGSRSRRSVGRLALETAAATAAIATIDLKLVPRRLTPGFERRLAPSSLALVYVALGAGLMAGTRWSALQQLRAKSEAAASEAPAPAAARAPRARSRSRMHS